MAIKMKALARGQLPSTAGSLYTVPSGKAAILKNMRFVNTGGSNQTFGLWIKRAGDSRRLRAVNAPINAAEMISDSGEVVLEAADSIEGSASASNTVDYVLSGVERDT